MGSLPDLKAVVHSGDCVVIITNHSSYDEIKMLKGFWLMVDTRDTLGTVRRDHPKVARL
jgi:UDP-N-acetyl-D-mannosaminuronate dehydrogenase